MTFAELVELNRWLNKNLGPRGKRYVVHYGDDGARHYECKNWVGEQLFVREVVL